MLMFSLFVPASLESLQYKAVILSLFSFVLFILSSLMKRDFLSTPIIRYSLFLISKEILQKKLEELTEMVDEDKNSQ